MTSLRIWNRRWCKFKKNRGSYELSQERCELYTLGAVRPDGLCGAHHAGGNGLYAFGMGGSSVVSAGCGRLHFTAVFSSVSSGPPAFRQVRESGERRARQGRPPWEKACGGGIPGPSDCRFLRTASLLHERDGCGRNGERGNGSDLRLPLCLPDFFFSLCLAEAASVCLDGTRNLCCRLSGALI